MQKLEEIIEKARRWLDVKDSVREFAIKKSREIIRLSSEIIQDIHKGALVESKINELFDNVQEFIARLEEHPDMMQMGLVRDTLQEYCEAMIFRELVEKGDVPNPDDLKAPLDSYLLGLCDVVGELRRKVLDSLRKGKTSDAIRFFNYMEEIYSKILRLHYPQGLIPLRPKQDAMRNIIERTRSDITMALMIEKFSRTSEEEPLDIDKVYP
ncbi:MAG: translin family protein [Thermoplasmata archaeon]|nr:translin family protein [Euryarchaeota archaeon]RLF66912.1 MAG: translin family protein [Thermoplasmata archaeon]